MKKRIFVNVMCLCLIFIIGASVLFNFNAKNKTKSKEIKLEKITLAEVAHTVFYAPMYVAIEEDFFEDEGIDINHIIKVALDDSDNENLLEPQNLSKYIKEKGEKL